MTEPGGNGYTLKEMVSEILADVKKLRDDVAVLHTTHEVIPDMETRLRTLEIEAVTTRQVAKALLTDKRTRFTRNEKFCGAIVVLVQLTVSVLALGPDILPGP